MGKKQHYVPQFLLRNWSEDKSSIKTYLLNENRIIPTAPISSQAQKHFFYGEDQEVENILCQLEEQSSLIISKLLVENFELSMEERGVIVHFIAMQNIRTPNAIQQTNDMASALARDLLIKEKKFEEFKENIKYLNVGFTDPTAKQLEFFLSTFLMYTDLKLCLLKANNDNEFVIGQDPIITLNPYLVEKRWPGPKRGIGIRGVIIVLPISPLYSLCLYDKTVYKILNGNNVSCLNNGDIDTLNKFQFLTTDNVIFFNNSLNNPEAITEETKRYREQPKANVQDFVNEKDPRKMLVAIQLEEYGLPQNFSFCAIREAAYRMVLDSYTVVRENTFYAERYYRSDPKFQFLFKDR